MQGGRRRRGSAGLSPERLHSLAAAEARCAEKTAACVIAVCAVRACLMGCMLWMQCARKGVQQDGASVGVVLLHELPRPTEVMEVECIHLCENVSVRVCECVLCVGARVCECVCVCVYMCMCTRACVRVRTPICIIKCNETQNHGKPNQPHTCPPNIMRIMCILLSIVPPGCVNKPHSTCRQASIIQFDCGAKSYAVYIHVRNRHHESAAWFQNPVASASRDKTHESTARRPPSAARSKFSSCL